MSQVLDLLTLQSLDDEATSLHTAFAAVRHRLEGDPELAGARETLAEVELRAKDIYHSQAELEAAIQRLGDRIAPEEKRLYDGSVKNPKELSSIQHEVELLRKERGKFEDQLLDALSDREGVDAELLLARKTAAQLEARWERQQVELKHESERLAGEVARAEANRDARRASLPPRALHVYDEVRRRKGGMAVVRIQGNACLGCRISIPETLRRRAMAPELLAQCPNCERILYVG